MARKVRIAQLRDLKTTRKFSATTTARKRKEFGSQSRERAAEEKTGAPELATRASNKYLCGQRERCEGRAIPMIN